jgi:uncharacterized protein
MRPLDPTTQIYLITDGKAGDLVQLKGVGEALQGRIEIRKISPRSPFTWAMPWFGTDPKETRNAFDGPLRFPFPHIAIATGRRTVTYLKLLKTRSPRSFSVFLKDPRTGLGAADLICVQGHDKLRGENVCVTTMAPHSIRAKTLFSLRDNPDPRINQLKKPLAAVLVGGKSRHYRFNRNDMSRFIGHLDRLAEQGVTLMMTASRRTPQILIEDLQRFAAQGPHFLWDGTGPNPYTSILARADMVVVTADSTNMIGEAAVTGRPIHIFWPEGHSDKINRFVAALSAKAVVRNLDGTLEWTTYPPLDATEEIANEVLRRYAVFRAAVGPLDV